MFRKIENLISSPTSKLIQAVIVALASLVEIFRISTGDILGVDIGAHHGLAVFGILQVITALGELVEKNEKFHEAIEKVKGQNAQE